MNTDFYEDLNTNFEQALKMAECDYSHDELIDLLKDGNIPQKQIAALKLSTVNNLNEAEILINNLIGCDGKIREAVALKIFNILKTEPSKVNLFDKPEIFAKATIDINANICRLVIDSVSYLKPLQNFSKLYLEFILTFINEAFEALDNFIFRDKKYVINKQLFKLYWCLEALKLFLDEIDSEVLTKILERCSKEREYTIREKAAQIINIMNDENFKDLIEILKLDENYYVRKALHH